MDIKQFTKQEIMDYTYVCERTARRWLNGTTRPSRAEQALLSIRKEHRELPHGWIYKVQHREITTPNNHSFNLGTLENYRTYMSCWRSMLNSYQQMSHVVEKLTARADRKDRARLERVLNIIESKTGAANEPYPLKPRLVHRADGC